MTHYMCVKAIMNSLLNHPTSICVCMPVSDKTGCDKMSDTGTEEKSPSRNGPKIVDELEVESGLELNRSFRNCGFGIISFQLLGDRRRRATVEAWSEIGPPPVSQG